MSESANGVGGGLPSGGPLWRVLGSLEDVRKSGGGYVARCPGSRHAHGDRHPSLGVKVGYDGKVLLHCPVGCDTTEILQRIGLNWNDLFEHSREGNPVRRFRLMDRQGRVIAEHVREDTPTGEKRIHWEANGHKGLNGTAVCDLPLYRLPDVLTADPSLPVILTEGEKSADALADLGLLAVGTVTGADQTPSASVLEPLQGREVWLWPDNDAPGHEHMLRIAQRITPTPRWIDWHEAPPKGDAADYVAGGGTGKGVAKLVRQPQAEPVKPTTKSGLRDVEILSAADLMGLELKEPRWAVPGIFPEGVVLLVGKSKLGKSWLALDVGIAVSEGTAVWGSIVVESGDVLYLALEDSKRRLQDRLRTLCGKRPPKRLSITTSWPRADEGGLQLIVEWLDKHPDARMVIVDVLGKFRPKEANNRRLYDMDYEAIAPIADVARERGVCVCVVHHTNKLNPDDPLDTVSGTTGLVGAADAICIFRRERGKADASLFVTGRDVDEQDLAFRRTLDQNLGYAWELIGDAEEARMSEARQAIYDLLTSSPGMKPADIAETLDKPRAGVRQLLFKMTKAGQLRLRDGGYFVP